jgi:release factor glutamine methyltransferase
MTRLDELRERWRGEAVERNLSPRDVDLLLADAIGRPMTYLIAHGEAAVGPDEQRSFERRIARRFGGEPVQYIRGRTEFFSHEFLVDRRVLIPRPETEILVEAALALAAEGARVLDVGTGSGCIAISIERSREDLEVFASDRSFDALLVACENRRRLQSHIRLFCADLLDGIGGTFDLIVSNPPYVAASEFADLDHSVREHEPAMALTPGQTGTETMERMLHGESRRLSPGGWLLFEIGFGQDGRVRELAGAAGWIVDRMIPDLAGIPRVVVLSLS